NFFSEPYCRKGDLSHQVPTSVCGARKKSVYLTTLCQIFGLIKMALVKMEDYQMAVHNIKKPSIRVPSFQPLLCRKVKTRPRKKMDRSLVTLTKQKSLIKKTLNNILSLWLLRQAIPWTRIEDPYL
ncbi:hypothetical protein VP01_13260g1, partial [Puccinia sorghi]